MGRHPETSTSADELLQSDGNPARLAVSDDDHMEDRAIPTARQLAELAWPMAADARPRTWVIASPTVIPAAAAGVSGATWIA